MAITIQDIDQATKGVLNVPPGGSLIGMYYSGAYGAPTYGYGGASGGPSGTTATPGTTAAGTLAGAAPYGYTPASGGIPAMPSPQTTQQTATAGNISALPSLTQLGQGVNAYTLAESMKPYEAFGLTPLLSQYRTNTGQQLAGQIPSDVLNNLWNYGAERGVATGMPGGPNANAAVMRALGLTSVGLQQQGAQNLTNLYGMMPKITPYNVASGFVSPEQQQAAQYQANVLAASPVPQAAYNQAMQNFLQAVSMGYGAGRTPMQAVPGASSTSPLSIAQKYGATVPGATSASGGAPGASGTGYATSSTGTGTSYSYDPYMDPDMAMYGTPSDYAYASGAPPSYGYTPYEYDIWLAQGSPEM